MEEVEWTRQQLNERRNSREIIFSRVYQPQTLQLLHSLRFI